MNIRLVKATQADFEVYKKYHQKSCYHWFIGARNRVERREAAKRPVKQYEPRFNRKGERIYRSSEKFALFNEEQYQEMIKSIRKSRCTQLYIIHKLIRQKDDKIIGYIMCRTEGKTKRIVEFALEPDYQRYQVIREVLEKINKLTKRTHQFEIIMVEAFGAQLLRYLPEIKVPINRGET